MISEAITDNNTEISDRPLDGRTVLVTRPAHQSQSVAELLENLGAKIWLLPVVEIVPIESSEIKEQSSNLADYDWIIFTSANGVAAFTGALKGLERSLKPKIAAIGPATAASLEALDLTVSAVPSEYISDAIPAALGDLAGKRILIPRAREARRDIIESLSSAGAEVTELPVYFARPNKDPEVLGFLNKKIEQKVVPDFITLTSSSSVRFLKEMLQGSGGEHWLKLSRLSCIGPITAKTVSDLGFTPTVIAKEYTASGLVEAIRRYCN